MKIKLYISLILCLLTAQPAVFAQNDTENVPESGIPEKIENVADIELQHTPFTFVRIQYATNGRGSGWATDIGEAEEGLTTHFAQETGFTVSTNALVMRLTDPRLKEMPFAYLVEGGGMNLSDEEARGLREYLLGGGFLMADDFWGEREWASFDSQIKKAFPDREPVEIPLDHEIFHSYYDILEKPQVPNVQLGIQSQFTGITREGGEDTKEPHYRGLFDDDGRLMAIFCHNTDLGDGWEREGESEYYRNEFSLKKALPMGINIVVYALTR